ncbi:hypothetical protein [Pseudaminobacter salicylatoxidans]|uniref:hypothetical protein n=1 Tax=Pseudaminobacter salicylatoxidans TaxID=93369 RepID=UPI00035FAC4B|nr:hypothetical protein [Pseudaminobacter salicylatoxidans]
MNTIRRDTLEYSQTMLRELRDMNNRPGNEFLTYILEMAYVEASDTLREIRKAELNYKRARDRLCAAARMSA